MLSLIAATILLTPPIEQPPRLRTILPNGAITLIEPHFESKLITIELVASSRGAEDTPQTHGWRHLLEHLVVKGRDGLLDQRLESEGGFLHAETLRDAIQIEIQVPPDKLATGLAAVEELLHEPNITGEGIARETPTLRSELALLDVSNLLANFGWSMVYRDSGLSPQGDLERMATATPADLTDLYLRHFRSSNMVLAISGPVDLDGGTKAATELLSRLPGSPKRAAFATRTQHPPPAGRVENTGQAMALTLAPYDSAETAASLTAAFAFASTLDSSFVIYTPSVRPGLVTVGSADLQQAAGSLAKLSDAQIDALYEVGVVLARSWLNGKIGNARAAISLRAFLLAADPDARPERAVEAMQHVSLDTYRAAFQRLKQGVPVVSQR